MGEKEIDRFSIDILCCIAIDIILIKYLTKCAIFSIIIANNGRDIMASEIAKRDAKLIGTEKLIEEIILGYKKLGYTEESAFAHLRDAVSDFELKRNQNKATERMASEIAKRDNELIGTEKLILKIIRGYKKLGYTEESAFAHLRDAVSDLELKRKQNESAELLVEKDDENYELNDSISTN